MKIYELMAILSGQLDEANYKTALDQVEKTIKSKGGTVTALDEWGKRKLAYAILHQDFGYYVVLRFTAEKAEVPSSIQAALKIQDNVLRSMITLAKARKAAAKPVEKTEKAEAVKE